MPKVSIILAVYNVEKYLRECLDSLVNQTLNDIEIICTDDGSTDNSLNILKEYQERDSRIKIIEQENQGPGVARNKAIEASNGKYIMIVDPDDWLELNTCELAYNQIEKNGNDIVLFDYIKYNDNTGKYITQSDQLYPFRDCINNPNINVSDLDTNFILNGFTWNKIYRRDFLQKYNIKFLPQYVGEDLSFSVVALSLSTNISIIDKPVYIYRQRGGSSSLTSSRWKEIFFARTQVSKILSDYKLKDSILKAYTVYSTGSLINWYNVFSASKFSQRKEYEEELVKYINSISDYNNKKLLFRKFIWQHKLIRNFYYSILRPFGKYCIVWPYRNIKKIISLRQN